MEVSEPNRRATLIAATAVFILAVVLRVPSCYESFWLDELHSAWCVWDSLSDVFPRANVGHQSPCYFVGLWFWKQVVGSAEASLRFSSVLAVAAGSAVLTISVARWTKSIAAGTAAGLILASESNSLFFGTELRPYALVILASCIAIAYFLRLTAVRCRSEDRAGWIGLIVAILVATLFQPTAIGVLGWLPLALLVVSLIRDRRRALTFTLTDGLLILSAVAVGFALWGLTLGDSWNQRTIWASFATARQISEIWEIWDWTWLLILPLGLMGCALLPARLCGAEPPPPNVASATLLLAGIALLVTGLYWLLSWMHWVPVWHRRYFIAVLPILACLSGGAVGVANAAIPPLGRYQLGGLLATAALVAALTISQGTLARLPDYPVALVTRGEDWRGAVAWVRGDVRRNDYVYLDAGLADANEQLPPLQDQDGPVEPTKKQLADYLTFAVRGPYQLRNKVMPIRRGLLARSTVTGQRRWYLIKRRPAHLVQTGGKTDRRVYGFGNVSVLVIDPNSENPSHRK